MDPKSTAKSKRNHTQHGRRTHQSPASIALKSKATTASSIRSLPSNWERYSKTDIDTEIQNKEAGREDVVIKSKGADFGYLIEQAKSQPQDFIFRKNDSALDEVTYDFMQGVSSMLSMRGEGLLSSCRNDNFVVDDDLTSSDEVPILSLDLNVLAAQLSKLKLSQRLFIGEDLLPEELNMTEDYTTTSQSNESGISEAAALECEHNNVDSDSQLKQKTTIETSGVETDLDTLLNSFSGISIFSTKDDQTANEDSSGSWINAKMISIDDSVDDLLAETSSCLLKSAQSSVTENSRSDSAWTNDEKDPSNSHPAKDQDVNDFDSWLDSL